MFVACGIWCLADVSSVSPSSEQTVMMGGQHEIMMGGQHEIHSILFKYQKSKKAAKNVKYV